MVINIVQGHFDLEERRVSVRRFLPPHPEGQELIAKLMRYFLGKPTEFTVDLPPDIGTDFQRTVWASLNKVPYGQYETYGELALPIIYPCHRIVASTGALTGYSAGPHWKKARLLHEGVAVHDDRVKVAPPPT